MPDTARPRTGLRAPKGDVDTLDTYDDTVADAFDLLETNMAMDAQGTLAAIPTSGKRGRYYYATDYKILLRDTGSSWVRVTPGVDRRQRAYEASMDTVASSSLTDLGDPAVAVNAPAGSRIEVGITFVAQGSADGAVGTVDLVIDGAAVLYEAAGSVTTVANPYSAHPTGFAPGRAAALLVFDADTCGLSGSHSYQLRWRLVSPFAGSFSVQQRVLTVAVIDITGGL